MPTRSTIATALMLSGTVLAGDHALTTIVPTCSGMPNITVTSQHQTVTDCGPSGSPTTSVWVSTVIPCYGGESTASSCTVTTTDQPVPCSATVTTSTKTSSTTSSAATGGWGNWENATHEDPSTYLDIISKQFVAPYHKLGPLVIPGYDGCDLCTDCGVLPDGSQQQEMDVWECEGPADGEPTCSKHSETWISLPVPSSTGVASAHVSSQTSCPEAGDYTFTFPQPAPTAVLTQGGHEFSAPADPWDAVFTTHVDGPTIIDFTMIITKIVTYNVPYSTAGPGGHGGAGGGHGGNGDGGSGDGGSGDGSNWAGWAAPTTDSSDPTDPAGAWDPWPSATAKPAPAWGNWGASSTTSETSSTSEGSSSTTGSTSVTSTTATTSTTVTTTTSTGPTPTSSFYLEVTITGIKRRRASCVNGKGAYLGFDDGSTDATIVAAAPGLFRFDEEGYLRFGDDYIQDGPSSGYFPMERGPAKPDSPKWSLVNGLLTYEGSTGFCAAVTNMFIVKIDSAPAGCRDAYAQSTSDATGPCSSTTTTSHSSTSTTVTTTTSADISGALDAEPTTATAARRRRGLRLKH